MADPHSYLYSLEQEVASLRAQVAALTSDDSSAGIGYAKRAMAASASEAMAGYRQPPPQPTPLRTDLPIDPMLQAEQESPMRSPWDSPGYSHSRRQSDYFPPPNGPGIPASPRSTSYVPSRLSLPHPTALSRMVHDAAFRTGHANDHIAVLNQRGPSANASGAGASVAGSATSDRGSHDSPYQPDGDGPGSLNGSGASASGSQSGRRGAANSPLVKSKLRREFAVPPLPPQPAVERLVAAYVDFIGVTAPIIHIPTLGRQLNRIREGRDVDESDVFVVMMIMGGSGSIRGRRAGH